MLFASNMAPGMGKSVGQTTTSGKTDIWKYYWMDCNDSVYTLMDPHSSCMRLAFFLVQ